MGFVKVVKNKAYFKRYQVKYRRRREGKTDYHARRRLILQDKNKYNASKHRLVVRITNQRILCQVLYATIKGDICIASADSSELKEYGIPVGHTNYSAAYATGLLIARRLLKKMGMADQFKGLEECTGEEYHVEEQADERRPFKCLLDVGIVTTTTGNRVFGAMKGACDGGLHVPHSTRRLVGTSGENKELTYDAEAHKARIYGSHVSNYMTEMKGEDLDKYNLHFSRYIKNGISADKLEAMYKNAHKKIRATPELKKKVRAHEPVHIRQGATIKTSKKSYTRNKKLTCDQRKERVMQKIALAAESAE